MFARIVSPARLLALMCWLAPVHGVRAQEFFTAPRDFVIDKPCSAYRSFKRQSDPTPLQPGETYAARGENRAGDPSHAFIRIGSESRWVALGCGHYADGSGPGTADHGGTGPGAGGDRRPSAKAGDDARQCLAFFDAIDNPVAIGFGGTLDITPPPPVLDAFDRAVNATCGAVGKVVAEDEFKVVMQGHGEVLERIRAFTGGRVFGDRPAAQSTAEYLDQLTEAWFRVKAFDHIFCGEPGSGRNTIGGLHFHGRYLQLQETGEACRMPNHRQNEAVPGVLYTFGVLMRTPRGGMARHARKGYGLTLGAEDLFKVVTRAFADNPTDRPDSAACMLGVRDDGKAFTAVFVRRAAGIRTFYPDATPSKKDPVCAGTIDLQEEIARR